jgi:hypothetical protein
MREFQRSQFQAVYLECIRLLRGICLFPGTLPIAMYLRSGKRLFDLLVALFAGCFSHRYGYRNIVRVKPRLTGVFRQQRPA